MHDPSSTPRDGAESRLPAPAGGIVRRWGIRYRELIALGESPADRLRVDSRPGPTSLYKPKLGR